MRKRSGNGWRLSVRICRAADADGYMSWDVEHWSSIDVKRFIRCYSLEGRVLGESTGHNIYDLENEFKPEEAAKIELS